MLEFAIATRAGLPAIRSFYAVNGYGGTVGDADLAFTARLDGRLAAVVRLCAEDGVTVLRGMQVAPGHQGRGLGRALLANCLPWLDGGDAYCLPYAQLAAFYGEAGFVPVAPAALPHFLAARLAAYRQAGKQVIAMRRRSLRTARPLHLPSRSWASRIA